jgi:GDPmannose 4,6-dehydratase
LDAVRDWGYAGDYAKAMWLIVQHSQPDDFVIATGESHSVREFVEVAFRKVGITIAWQGQGEGERGIDADTGRVLIEIDRRYFRPTEVDRLQGDASKARRLLGWEPRMTFDHLVSIMVDSDLREAKKEQLCNEAGLG